MTPSLSLDLAGSTHQSRLSLTSLPTLRHVATSTALSVSATRMIHCDIISSRSAAAATTPVPPALHPHYSAHSSMTRGLLLHTWRGLSTRTSMCWTQARVLQNGWTDWDVVWGYGVVMGGMEWWRSMWAWRCGSGLLAAPVGRSGRSQSGRQTYMYSGAC